MKRVVLDCNVLISAGISDGVCRRVLEYALQQMFIITCPTIEEEYRNVFQRPKFSAHHEQLTALLNDVLEAAYCIEASPSPIISPDHKDQPYIDTAITAQADYLITGNLQHFPDKQAFSTIIISPAGFLKLLPEDSTH